jgi:hypothetical protein
LPEDHPARTIFRDVAEAERNEAAADPSSHPTTPVTPATSVTPVTRVTGEIENVAPRRDFTRFANSIVRDAIPAGMFTGKGKQLYDYLYSQTRGAIVPTRTVRLPTGQVMRGAGMTRPTYRAHITRLIASGLIELEEKGGEHGGNLFTVYLPEEIVNPGNRGNRGNTGYQGKNLDGQQGKEIDPGNRGLSVDFPTISEVPKTLIKTDEKTDDEAFAELIEVLQAKTKEVTGRESSLTDRARWRELGELLTAELGIAAARTSLVSSAPALLVEHLRRRLTTKPTARQPSPTPAVEPLPTPAPTPPTDAELVETFVTFLHTGMTVEDLDGQLSHSVDPERWPEIRAAVINRFERERSHISSPTTPGAGD